MSGSNLFDYGRGSQQFAIIKPFLDRIRIRSIGELYSPEFQNFFLNQLESCLAMVGELSDKPSWVVDVDDYRMKTEIAIFSSLFSAIKFSSTLDKEQSLGFVIEFNNAICEFGARRNWNGDLLYLQIIRTMNSQHMNMLQMLGRRELQSFDLN
jgi:hypothetical protein